MYGKTQQGVGAGSFRQTGLYGQPATAQGPAPAPASQPGQRLPPSDTFGYGGPAQSLPGQAFGTPGAGPSAPMLGVQGFGQVPAAQQGAVYGVQQVPVANGLNQAEILSQLKTVAKQRKLTGTFYNEPALAMIAADLASTNFSGARQHLGFSPKTMMTVAPAALYDTFVIVHTPGAQADEHLNRLMPCLLLLDKDGSPVETTPPNGVLSAHLNDLLGRVVRSKNPAHPGKPVQLLVVTNGAFDRKEQNAILQVLADMKQYNKDTFKTSGATVYQFVHVPSVDRNRAAAGRANLNQLDDDRDVGHLVDSTSDFLSEQAQHMTGFNKRSNFTQADWAAKAIAGAIDKRLDVGDEGLVGGLKKLGLRFGR